MGNPTEQGTATGQPDAILHNIGIQFWLSALKDFDYFAFNLGNGLVDAGRDLLVGYHGLCGMGCDHIAANNVEILRLIFRRQIRYHRTDGELDLLGGSTTNTDVVLLCQILSQLFGLHLDGWCGLAVSLFILFTGFKTVAETSGPLLGQAPDPELADEIVERVLHTEGILDMHDLLIHDYGPGHLIVSLHAEVPSDFTLVHAHEIIDRLESRLDTELGVMSVIHIDPVDSHDHVAHLLRSRILRKLRSMHPDAGLHDFRILRGEDRPAVSFDAQFPFEYKENDEAIVSALTDYIAGELPGYQALIRVDRI